MLVCASGDIHGVLDRLYADGVPCVGLNKVGMQGNLIAVELDERGMEWSIVAEWPERL